MYSLPSASQMWEPFPRTMWSGSPPTERKARTGEFTPPGMSCSARLCSLRDCSVLRGIVSDISFNIAARVGGRAARARAPSLPGARNSRSFAPPPHHAKTARGGGPRSLRMTILVEGRAERNLPDFHRTATLPKRVEAILGSVALLTGRDHKDGLGGLRAVLFALAWILIGGSFVA
jgi:hypothetical protein